MLNKKEIFSIISITLVLSVILSVKVNDLNEFKQIFFPTMGIVLLVLLINIIAKKVTAYFFDSTIEVSTWEWKRYGYKPTQTFKSNIPFGFFMPLILKFLSMGFINWMACLTFDVKGTIYRARKNWGLYQYSEVTEEEVGWIAFAGIVANLLFALLGYLIDAPTFAKINLIYAFCNVIPLSNLDGAKIFFGKKSLWITIAILASIGLVASLVII